ncbi:MAG: hypothetical protein M1504_01665 [Candidatus Marsarchaeota archaeon]|nr:hypothetical protein [Candidatus Marsarchaeota archaeon]
MRKGGRRINNQQGLARLTGLLHTVEADVSDPGKAREDFKIAEQHLSDGNFVDAAINYFKVSNSASADKDYSQKIRNTAEWLDAHAVCDLEETGLFVLNACAANGATEIDVHAGIMGNGLSFTFNLSKIGPNIEHMLQDVKEKRRKLESEYPEHITEELLTRVKKTYETLKAYVNRSDIEENRLVAETKMRLAHLESVMKADADSEKSREAAHQILGKMLSDMAMFAVKEINARGMSKIRASTNVLGIGMEVTFDVDRIVEAAASEAENT